MRATYEQVRKRVELIDFHQVYEGFHSFPFALYNQKDVYLADKVIPRDESFFGNTAIAYEGSYLAIWNLEMSPIEDYDRLTSKIVP
jgi:hypothetical protein